jgi:predicted AlkP superfamily pyrophosphatase or phosphodiesterase
MTFVRRSAVGAFVALAALFVAVPAGPVRAQSAPPRPRLVVMFVVDQLRPDYLERFRRFFGTGGFERLMREGAVMAQARHAHAITKTCPGHATIATGTYANVNGMIVNEWFDAANRRIENCVHDPAARLIGVDLEGRSPKNLIGSTIGDVLRLHTQGRSRVITVSSKDRSAIVLGGHLAEAAYWLEDTLFVTSTYYRRDLPEWVRRFNASGAVTAYFGKVWDRVLPVQAYADLAPDDDPAERNESGLGRTFPHRLGDGESRPGPQYVGALEYSPFENELVIAFAMEALRNERLGQDSVTDILGISLASNDYVGHAYGPDSHEILDVTYRTDRLLERFFTFLDREVGLANTLIVLTADHGVAPLPEVMNRMNPRSGAKRIDMTLLSAAATAALDAEYGAQLGSWILHHDGPYIYLDETLLALRGIVIEDAERTVKNALARRPEVFAAYTKSELRRLRDAGQLSDVLLSFHPERSGNILYITAPYVVETEHAQGAEHGQPWSYDTHVPMIWLGPWVRAGTYHTELFVADIAPTLAAILGIDRPAGAKGRVLMEILR